MFKYIVLITSVSIAGVAAFFSVSGLGKLFAGAFIPVIIMASVLEIGKLVTASLLTRHWLDLTKLLRTYYMIAVGVLIIITSAGIYGFLTSAYQTTADELRVLESQTQVLQARRDRYQEQLPSTRTQLESVNQTISQLTEGLVNNQIQYVDQETGQLVTSTSRATREAIQDQLTTANQERTELNNRISEYNDSITSIDLQMVELNSTSEVAAEIGPLRYLSNLTGISMDRVVNYFSLGLIFVFDPLAVSLVVAYNRLQMTRSQKDHDPDDEGGSWIYTDPLNNPTGPLTTGYWEPEGDNIVSPPITYSSGTSFSGSDFSNTEIWVNNDQDEITEELKEGLDKRIDDVLSLKEEKVEKTDDSKNKGGPSGITRFFRRGT